MMYQFIVRSIVVSRGGHRFPPLFATSTGIFGDQQATADIRILSTFPPLYRRRIFFSLR